MATKKITYPQKARGDKWKSTEANQLKEVINYNADELAELQEVVPTKVAGVIVNGTELAKNAAGKVSLTVPSVTADLTNFSSTDAAQAGEVARKIVALNGKVVADVQLERKDDGTIEQTFYNSAGQKLDDLTVVFPLAEYDLEGYATEEWVGQQGFLTGVSWGDITGKPSTFAPSDHDHDSRYNINTTTKTITLGTNSITVVSPSDLKSLVLRKGDSNVFSYDPTIGTTVDISNLGVVTAIKLGGSNNYNPENGVVTLPAYPTTLPASDVSSWAKQSSKPTYTLDEVSDGTTRKLSDYQQKITFYNTKAGDAPYLLSHIYLPLSGVGGGIASLDLSDYQPKISNLATIASNAANGQTAYGWGNHANAGYQKNAIEKIVLIGNVDADKTELTGKTVQLPLASTNKSGVVMIGDGLKDEENHLTVRLGTGMMFENNNDVSYVAVSFGSGENQVARGNHDHDGVYALVSALNNYLPLTMPNGGKIINMPGINSAVTFKSTASDYPLIRFEGKTAGGLGFLGIGSTNSVIHPYFVTAPSGNYVEDGPDKSIWNIIWHAGNDGSGSGLDADQLDGKHANELFTDLSNVAEGESTKLSITIGGVTKKIQVVSATNAYSATMADTADTATTATTASKLSTVSKKAWGLTYWTSGGVPQDVSGNMTGVGTISASGDNTITKSGTNASRFIAVNGTGTIELMAAETNRGVYDRTNSRWLIGTGIPSGGSSAVSFLMGGNVGVGTTNPLSKLHVAGDLRLGSTTSDRYRLYFGDGQKVWIGEDADDLADSLTLHADAKVILESGDGVYNVMYDNSLCSIWHEGNLDPSAFVTTTQLSSNYWLKTALKGVKVGNTTYAPTASGNNEGWIDISDEFSGISNSKVSKSGDSMSGNLTMGSATFVAFRKDSTNNAGTIGHGTFKPSGASANVDGIVISGPVNFDNDGLSPYVAGSPLATQSWVGQQGFVTGIKVGANGTTLSPSSGVVTLPAYPTKASWNYDDVYLKRTGGNIISPLHQALQVGSNIVATSTDTIEWVGVKFSHWATVNGSEVETMYGGLRIDEKDGSFFRYNSSYTKYKIWDENNDGSTSGLDADLLDGKHASDFLLANGMYTENNGISDFSVNFPQNDNHDSEMDVDFQGGASYNFDADVFVNNKEVATQSWVSQNYALKSELHTHSNKAVLDSITEAMVTKLNGIEAGANKYTHPTNGANTTIAAADGRVLSAITVNNLGHVTSVSYKALLNSDIPSTLTLNALTVSGAIGGSSADFDSLTKGGVNVATVNDIPSTSNFLLINTAGGIASVSGGGNNWYFKIATINITATYINRPVVFEISQRGYEFSLLQVIFNSINGTDPTLRSFTTNNVDVYYIKKVATSKWEIYGRYYEVWGQATIHRITGCGADIGVTVNMVNIGMEPPSDTTQCLRSVSLEGHTHGSITNDGKISDGTVSIGVGDALLITDNSNSNKIVRSNIIFNGSDKTKALTPAGTFETFLTSYTEQYQGTITKVGNTTSGAVAVTSGNNTASFGSSVTVGTVGGVDLKVTMPSASIQSGVISIAGQTINMSNYASSTHNHDNTYLKLTGGTLSNANRGVLTLTQTGVQTTDDSVGPFITFRIGNSDVGYFGYNTSSGFFMQLAGVKTFKITPQGELRYDNQKVWYAGNDGSGSGLDADLLDGVHANGLFTNLSNTTDGNLSITIGGVTKTLAIVKATNAYEADLLGSSTVGSTTKGIYLSNGSPAEMTYSLGSTVDAGTLNRIAYYKGANEVAANGYIAYIPHTETAAESGTLTNGKKYIDGLRLWGTTVGNLYTVNGASKATTISGITGDITFGDAGPQIQFSTGSGTAQDGALIYTDHDSAGAGASFHFVTNQSDWNVHSKRFVARDSVTIGYQAVANGAFVPNTTHALFVGGSTLITGNTYIGSASTDNLVATRKWVTDKGYQTNAIETVKVNNSALTVSSKAVNIPIAGDQTAGVVMIGTNGVKMVENHLEVDTTWLANQVSGSYLPLSGGTMTGNISYRGTKATYEMIKFVDNTSDANGNGISIGGGGAVVIGGGESSTVMESQLTSGGNESLMLGNDGQVGIYSNLQNGWASRHELLFGAGQLTLDGAGITERTYYLSCTNGKDSAIKDYWHKLGDYTTAGDNSNFIIEILSGDGYNGNEILSNGTQRNQHFFARVIIKDGWQSTRAAVNSVGVTVERFVTSANMQVRIVATSDTQGAVWVLLPWNYKNGNYTVKGRYTSWVHNSSSTDSPTDDPAHNQTPVIYFDNAYLTSTVANAEKLGGVSASNYALASSVLDYFESSVVSLGTNGNSLTWTTGINNTYSLTVPYATTSETASKLGTSNVGSSTKGIYLSGGSPAEMTHSLNATVNASTSGYMTYYSDSNAISGSSYVRLLSETNSKSKAEGGLEIVATGYGNAADLISGTDGIISYGDGGPQIRFSPASAQHVALIATHFDVAGAGASLHLVSDQSRVAFVTQEIVGKTRLSVGGNTPNTSYNLYVNGTTNLKGAVTVSAAEAGRASLTVDGTGTFNTSVVVGSASSAGSLIVNGAVTLGRSGQTDSIVINGYDVLFNARSVNIDDGSGSKRLLTTADLSTYLPLSGGTLTGNVTFNGTGKGLWAQDGTGTYAMFYHNGTNLWIGAEAGAKYHHKGATYISAGWSGSAGNPTIYVSVPTTNSTTATNTYNSYAVLHAGNYTSYLTGYQSKLHFYNTKNSNTEAQFSNLYLPLANVSSGNAELDLSGYLPIGSRITATYENRTPSVAGSTTGYVLIGQFTHNPGTGGYRRSWATLLVGSRHNGSQIVNIIFGCEQALANFTLNNAFCDISQFGTTANSTADDVFYCYAKMDGSNIVWSLFWRNRDYSPADITVLRSGGNATFTLSNGAWMTSIDGDTYGTLKGKGKRNPASFSCTLWGQSFDGTGNVDGKMTINYTGTSAAELITLKAPNASYNCISYNKVSGGYNWSAGINANGFYFWNSNIGSQVMLVSNNGNLGVGTGWTATNLPSAKLHVVGTAKFTSDLSVGGELYMEASSPQIRMGTSSHNVLDLYTDTTAPALRLGWESSTYMPTEIYGYGVDIDANSYIDMMIGGTSALYVENNGYVGVNNDNPQYQLDVNGNVMVSGELKFDANSSVKLDSNAIVLQGSAGVKMKYGNNERLIVKSAGIEINGSLTVKGSSSTQVTMNNGSLSASGTITGQEFVFSGGVSSNTYISLKNEQSSTTTTPVIEHNAGLGGKHYFKMWQNTTTMAWANVYANTFVGQSDIRKKDIDKYLEPSVYDMAFAPLIAFKWKNGDNRQNVGTIAQYWEKVMPQAVHKDGEGYLSLEYSTIALAAGVTASRKAVDNERRIMDLEREIAALRARVEELEAEAA